MTLLDVTRLSSDEGEGLALTISELMRGVGYALGQNVLGIYLVGSYALGAGDRHSDLDFAVVTHHPVSATNLPMLEGLHARLPSHGSFCADHLEGSYLPAGVLRGASDDEWLYVDNGSTTVGPSSHDDTLAFRWVLRNHGVALFGPDARTLLDDVDDVALRQESVQRAHDWRELLSTTPDTVADSWAQTHFVTGFCRLLYTHSTGSIASKTEATRWAAHRLESRWAPLLGRANDDRETTWARRGTATDPVLAAQTIQLGDAIVEAMAA